MPKRHAILPVKDVHQTVFIRKLALFLKKSGKIQPPEWTDAVKTATCKELPPNNLDWYYVRVASVARRVYVRSPTGVGALARRYGGRNCRGGVIPEHTTPASRKIIRTAMQQLEKMGWMKKAVKGRKLTMVGRRAMEDFSVRARRSRMVNQYWNSRRKQEHKQRKQGHQGAVRDEQVQPAQTTQGAPQPDPYEQPHDVVEVEQYE
jgi:small subunit ribosomal protein S19e